MSVSLYPLRFEPIFQSMLWGGGRLPGLFGREAAGPVGEAWVLSDVDGHPSRVANGPLAGTTLRQLLAADPKRVLGPGVAPHGRFPLLLKFIDAKQELSVQVHPTDEQAEAKRPGTAGKTEAWVVLDADPATSRIYAGFRPGVTADGFRSALAAKTTPGTLHSFTPRPGDCVFLSAGTVHAIGANTLIFEVQQTSDTTYRLYDWDRVDAKTGRARELHVADGLDCSDFAAGPCDPVTPEAVPFHGGRKEKLVGCGHFTLHRVATDKPVTLGAAGECRAVVVVAGRGDLGGEAVGFGDVVLLPAEVGACGLVPAGPMTVLECGLPQARAGELRLAG
jgi:mannose-6-phosphate isomerase